MVAPSYNDHQESAGHTTVKEQGSCIIRESHLSSNSTILPKTDLPQLQGESTMTSIAQSDTIAPAASSIGRGDGLDEYDKSHSLTTTITTNPRLVSRTRATSKELRQSTQSVGVTNESKQHTSDLTSTKESFALGDKTCCTNPSEGGEKYLDGVDGGKALGNTKAINPILPAHVSFESGPTSTCRAHTQQSALADQPQSSDAPEISAKSMASEAPSQLACLGYKQELYRTWDFWSSFSLTFCNIGVMSGSLSNMNGAVGTSGPIIMTVGYITMSFLILCTLATTAEVASSFPVAGAMFTWTFKLARATPCLRNSANLLSWVIGFCLFFSHIMLQLQIGYDFCMYLTSTFVASGVDWDVTKHTNMALLLAYILLCGLLSITPFVRSPGAWKIFGALSALLHIGACILMVSTAQQKRKFGQLFKFKDTHKSGFNKGYTFVYGCITSTITLGSETASHMAEETKDPASTVPRVIFWSQFFAIVMGLLSNICVCIVLGPIHPHRTPITAMPFIEAIFWHCPKPVAHFVAFTVLFNHVLCDVSQYLATSRYFWALARDKAIPLAKFWRTVTSDRQPIRASLLFILITMVLSVVVYETSDTLRIITLQSTSVLISICYLVPILLLIFAPNGVLARDGRNLWSLRSFSRPIACMGACHLCLTIAVLSGPSHMPAGYEDLPWGIVGGIFCIGLALLFWFLYGRSHYVGPVKSLTIWTVGHEIEIPKRIPRTNTPQGTKSKLETMCAEPKTVHGRSAAYLSSEPARTFGIPQTYCTYRSDGSLWTPSRIEDQSIH